MRSLPAPALYTVNFAYVCVHVAEVGAAGRYMGALRLVNLLTGTPVFWFSNPATNTLDTSAGLAGSLLH